MTFVSHTDVGGRRRLHPAAELPGVVHGTLAGQSAPEHLPVGIPEVLRQEGVDDGVDRRVAVGQAVSHHPEHERGLVQGERAKLHPQVHDVVGQPRQAEDHHHHQDCLGRLLGVRGVESEIMSCDQTVTGSSAEQEMREVAK